MKPLRFLRTLAALIPSLAGATAQIPDALQIGDQRHALLSEPLQATWFSGRLLVALGKMTEYVPMGYESKYERYLVLTVHSGVVVQREESAERPR